MSRRFPWNRLGIDETSDTGAIRKAYADALRATNVDEDIAGYAELRRARDQALWLAAQSQRGEAEEDDLGLGDWDDDADDWDDDDGAWDIAPGIQRPVPAPSTTTPAPSPAPTSELSEAQARAQAAWNQLLDVLYPDGDPSDEAVTHAELDDGLAALHTLIARAEEADLEEHDGLDSALADLFARTWPRSAPFVEPANAAFHWIDEAGALDERAALRFLNDRLKGMRFHEKVQQTGHPLHKAWAELSRPGRAGVLDRLRVKRLEVDKLLTGIRQRYPELESHLDSERVASWDKQGSLEGNPGGLAPRIVRGMVIAFCVMLVLGFVADALERNDRNSAPPVVEAAPSAAQIDAQIAEVFGKDVGIAEVRAADPSFADQLDPLVAFPAQGKGALLAYVRMKAIASATSADEANLAVRADLKSLWMTAARRQSDAVCREVMTAKFLGIDLGLTGKERDRERALLRQLLDAKLLGKRVESGEFRYSIPGWLVEDVIKRSGLPEKRMVAALTDPENADRCTAEASLIEAARASSRAVPKDVMKGL